MQDNVVEVGCFGGRIGNLEHLKMNVQLENAFSLSMFDAVVDSGIFFFGRLLRKVPALSSVVEACTPGKFPSSNVFSTILGCFAN